MFPNLSGLVVESVGARLTTEQRKLAQEVWGQGWANDDLDAELVKRRKEYIRRVTRASPYAAPRTVKANAPDDTWPAGQRPTTPAAPQAAPQATPQATPQAAPLVTDSRLFLDIPAVDRDYDDETIFYIRAPVESVSALQEMTVSTGRAALLSVVDPRVAKIWTPPYNAPEVSLHTSDDPYDTERPFYSNVPWSERPLYIIVQGQDGYDGPGPQMASFGAPNRSASNLALMINRLMDWFRADQGHAWFQDERGLYGPVDDWVGRALDKRALSISSELYVYLTDAQKHELLRFGYDEVHVQATSDYLIENYHLMEIYKNPSDDGDGTASQATLWKDRLRRRNLPDTTDVEFLYRKAYAQSLPNMVQAAFRRHDGA